MGQGVLLDQIRNFLKVASKILSCREQNEAARKLQDELVALLRVPAVEHAWQRSLISTN